MKEFLKTVVSFLYYAAFEGGYVTWLFVVVAYVIFAIIWVMTGHSL